MKKIHYTDRYLLNPYHPVTVFVIGAGGTGSQVATGLARMKMCIRDRMMIHNKSDPKAGVQVVSEIDKDGKVKTVPADEKLSLIHI